MARLRILTFISLFLSGVVFFIKNRNPSTIPAGKGLVINKNWLTINPHPLTAQKGIRPPDQTFLTYPEWFLVFSPAEQADYFKQHTGTTFPYLTHVDQLWKGYDVVNEQIKGNYKFNTGYHVMIMVIAGSTTAEYGLKSWYETVVGRVTDTDPSTELTAEDQFNQKYMGSYVSFIEQTPWYEYDFNKQLKNLWSATSFFGPHFLRKVERKYYLTTELLIKSGYGWLIKQGTKASYEPALLNTAVVVDSLPKSIKSLPEVENVKSISNGDVSADLPRYADFNQAACKLALAGVNFKEIAGNNSAIMLTVLSSVPVTNNKYWATLFTQPIVTRPGLRRVALVTPVKNLSAVITMLKGNNMNIEHIYDY